MKTSKRGKPTAAKRAASRDMLSAGFPQSAAAGRDALDTFVKDNPYKYDVIAMKDTDTGTQTYIVADRGPVHPARNGSRDGPKNNAREAREKPPKSSGSP